MTARRRDDRRPTKRCPASASCRPTGTVDHPVPGTGRRAAGRLDGHAALGGRAARPVRPAAARWSRSTTTGSTCRFTGEPAGRAEPTRTSAAAAASRSCMMRPGRGGRPTAGSTTSASGRYAPTSPTSSCDRGAGDGAAHPARRGGGGVPGHGHQGELDAAAGARCAARCRWRWWPSSTTRTRPRPRIIRRYIMRSQLLRARTAASEGLRVARGPDVTRLRHARAPRSTRSGVLVVSVLASRSRSTGSSDIGRRAWAALGRLGPAGQRPGQRRRLDRTTGLGDGRPAGRLTGTTTRRLPAARRQTATIVQAQDPARTAYTYPGGRLLSPTGHHPVHDAGAALHPDPTHPGPPPRRALAGSTWSRPRWCWACSTPPRSTRRSRPSSTTPRSPATTPPASSCRAGRRHPRPTSPPA